MNIVLISIGVFLLLVLIVWWRLLRLEIKKDLEECSLMNKDEETRVDE